MTLVKTAPDHPLDTHLTMAKDRPTGAPFRPTTHVTSLKRPSKRARPLPRAVEICPRVSRISFALSFFQEHSRNLHATRFG